MQYLRRFRRDNFPYEPLRQNGASMKRCVRLGQRVRVPGKRSQPRGRQLRRWRPVDCAVGNPQVDELAYLRHIISDLTARGNTSGKGAVFLRASPTAAGWLTSQSGLR
jgi:hypothetical protein